MLPAHHQTRILYVRRAIRIVIACLVYPIFFSTDITVYVIERLTALRSPASVRLSMAIVGGVTLLMAVRNDLLMCVCRWVLARTLPTYIYEMYILPQEGEIGIGRTFVAFWDFRFEIRVEVTMSFYSFCTSLLSLAVHIVLVLWLLLAYVCTIAISFPLNFALSTFTAMCLILAIIF